MSVKLIDSHNHTMHFSIDADQTLDELIEGAVQQGLKGVAVTEHYDKDVIDGFFQVGISPVGSLPQRDEWVFNIEAYLNIINEKKQLLERQGIEFELLSGIELGYMPYLADELDRLMDQYTFDVVLGSVHCLDYRDLYHYPELYAEEKKQAYSRYLETNIEMLQKQHNFDVFAHFDYIARYADYKDNRIAYADFPDYFDELFRLLIDGGKSLEINTRTRYKALSAGKDDLGFPDANIILRYLELGGKMFTLSSDSHKSGEVGAFFPETVEWLKHLGVSYLTYFKKRQPVLLPI